MPRVYKLLDEIRRELFNETNAKVGSGRHIWRATLRLSRYSAWTFWVDLLRSQVNLRLFDFSIDFVILVTELSTRAGWCWGWSTQSHTRLQGSLHQRTCVEKDKLRARNRLKTFLIIVKRPQVAYAKARRSSCGCGVRIDPLLARVVAEIERENIVTFLGDFRTLSGFHCTTLRCDGCWRAKRIRVFP